jgi:hypothetical protein
VTRRHILGLLIGAPIAPVIAEAVASPAPLKYDSPRAGPVICITRTKLFDIRATRFIVSRDGKELFFADVTDEWLADEGLDRIHRRLVDAVHGLSEQQFLNLL